MSHRILLVLLMCFTQVACGDAPDKGTNGDDNNSAANTDNGADNSSSQNSNSSNNSDNTTNTTNGCDAPARCEGDEIVTCEVSDSGVPVTTRSFCSAGCSDGECQGPPQEVTVSGTYPSQDPITIMDDGKLITSATARAESPDYSAELPDSININADEATYTIQSPDEGDCATGLTVVLSNSEVSVSVVGEDELPATDCNTFASNVASDGIALVAQNVPYLNIGGTVEVTIELQAQ